VCVCVFVRKGVGARVYTCVYEEGIAGKIRALSSLQVSSPHAQDDRIHTHTGECAMIMSFTRNSADGQKSGRPVLLLFLK